MTSLRHRSKYQTKYCTPFFLFILFECVWRCAVVWSSLEFDEFMSCEEKCSWWCEQSWWCLCLWLCRTSVMGCRGVKNVWFAKFFSSPSGNSETHTAPHTNIHTYTRARTNAHQKTHSYTLRERHRRCLTRTARKTHVRDRVSTRHSKESHTDHQAHTRRKKHTVHKICTFQNTYTVMNMVTKGKKRTCLRTHTHQKLNLPTHSRTCRHSPKYVQGKLHTTRSIQTCKETHTRSRGILHQPGHYAHTKHKIVRRWWTPNTQKVKNSSTSTQWKTHRHCWALQSRPGLWDHTLPQASVVSTISTPLLFCLSHSCNSVALSQLIIPVYWPVLFSQFS